MSLLPDDPRDDAQLVAGISRGDSAAFEALYRRHRDWVVRIARRLTGDDAAALDVMQEAFMYLLRRGDRLRLSGRLTTLLYPVVKHIAAEHRREARRLILHERPPEQPSAPAEERTDLNAVLAGLSEEHRETVLLRFVDDLSLEEIAAAMSVPLGTVKSRLHHALRTLREDPRTKIYFQR